MVESIDYERLRNDLMDEYGAQGAAFSGGFGFMEMCDAQNASDEQLIEMARNEHIDLEQYKHEQVRDYQHSRSLIFGLISIIIWGEQR